MEKLKTPAQALAQVGYDYYELRVLGLLVWEGNHLDNALDVWNKWNVNPNRTLYKNGEQILPKAPERPRD